MGARGKFGEHESNSSFVNALQTSQVHPYLDMRIAKSMNQFFCNIANKNTCFLINWKILVTHVTEKQTLPLVGFEHAAIV